MLRDRGVNMNSVKAVVAAFNQEKALVGAFSVITNLRMELFEELRANTAPPPRTLGPFFVFYINDNWNTALSLVTWTKMFFQLDSAIMFFKSSCKNERSGKKGAQWHWPRQQDRGHVQKPRVQCPMSTLDIINHYSQLIYDAAKDT